MERCGLGKKSRQKFQKFLMSWVEVFFINAENEISSGDP